MAGTRLHCASGLEGLLANQRRLPGVLNHAVDEAAKGKGLSIFERYLSVWVLLCIGGGIALGKIAPQVARFFDGLAISVKGAPIVAVSGLMGEGI